MINVIRLPILCVCVHKRYHIYKIASSGYTFRMPCGPSSSMKCWNESKYPIAGSLNTCCWCSLPGLRTEGGGGGLTPIFSNRPLHQITMHVENVHRRWMDKPCKKSDVCNRINAPTSTDIRIWRRPTTTSNSGRTTSCWRLTQGAEPPGRRRSCGPWRTSVAWTRLMKSRTAIARYL